MGWYGGGDRCVAVATGTGHWHKSGKGLVALRWVYVRDLQGTHRDEYFFSNDPSLSPTQIIGYYTGRWSIELLFKELKSEFGMAQYRLRCFAAIESWVEACLITFLYLEWYRCVEMQKGCTERKAWFACQRSGGLKAAVIHRGEQAELEKIGQYAQSKTGRAKLRKLLRKALPLEQRLAA